MRTRNIRIFATGLALLPLLAPLGVGAAQASTDWLDGTSEPAPTQQKHDGQRANGKKKPAPKPKPTPGPQEGGGEG